jgi:GTPase
MFLDEVTLSVAAGSGGDGAATFRREAHVPRGGPDGGDGGRGGSVYLVVDPGQTTFGDYRHRHHFRATSGGRGERSRRHGKAGRDLDLAVPPGTVVRDAGTGDLMADLVATGQRVLVARGGRGGLGNTHFATSTHQAPRHAQKGEPGEERRLRLELRLIADIGLVGLPNAGKSTLLAALTAARPKVGDYPFTTLEPNLGVVKAGDDSFVVADIPGLVPGAHEGKGLGDRFLRHVKRAAVLVFIVDLAAVDRDPFEDVNVLREEIESFDAELVRRPTLVVANKVDVGRDRVDEMTKRFPDAVVISAVTGEGVDVLVARLTETVASVRAKEPARAGYVRYVIKPEKIEVTREDSAWRVRASKAERAVAMTDLDNDEAVRRLQRKLISMGVERTLQESGARLGDEVRIGDAAFEFQPEKVVQDDET